MMDHCGPMATSVADIATLLSVMAGYDLLDHRMTPETPLRANVPDYAQNLAARIEAKKTKGEWTPSQAGRGLRVGILTEAWSAPTLSAEVAATVRAAASRFARLGASVADVSVPLHADGPLIWTAATRAQMAAVGTANAAPAAGSPSHNLPLLRPPHPLTQRWLDLLSRHNPAMVNVVLSAEFLGHKYHPAAVAKAHAHVLQLRAAYDAALRECDVLVTPVTPTVAPPHPPLDGTWGVMERMRVAAGNSANTCPFNVTGHPALSMPVGWGAAAGAGAGGGGEGEQEVKTLPIGMQIIGRRWDEDTVLYAASVWEVGGLGLESVYKPQA